LWVPAVRLDESWTPLAPQGEALRAMLLAANPTGAWEDAFARQAEFGNHAATEWILDTVRAVGALPTETMEQLTARRTQHLEEAREQLEAHRSRARTEIERASGVLLSEQEYLTYLERLGDQDVETILDFPSAQEKLSEIERELEGRWRARKNEFSQRLATQRLPADLLARVRAAVDQGDLVLASGLLDLGGEALGPTSQSAFDAPFLAFVEACDRARQRRGAAGFTAGVGPALAGSVQQEPLDFSALVEDRRAQALTLWEAWRSLCSRTPSEQRSAVEALLIGLKFEPTDLGQIGREAGETWAGTVGVRPVAESLHCPIPAFGSEARGSYVLHATASREPIEDLLLGIPRDQRAHLVLLTAAPLDVHARRELARTCHSRRHAVLVIDETLILFLASRGVPGLRTLFECTLPFTWANPYIPSGPVAAEMFFGRDRERQAIEAPRGTNLVFGGRQLGKTALLADIQRRHAGSPDFICRLIDLKAESIGTVRPPQDIWPLLARVLHQAEVVKTDHTGADTLRKNVALWLDGHPERRILLLLDEADAFLEQDSHAHRAQRQDAGFENLIALKRLMEETKWRFKVVFAGLHDVQRTSRNPNSPLAHLGTPICIGPLLENGEWQRARDLIARPLRALGLRFESDDVLVRILAHTNHYPSLVQVFCHKLLEHVIQRHERGLIEGPPYALTLRDVEDAYQSQDLRRELRQRFIWTLNLDPRYRVIALAMVHDYLETRAEVQAAGQDTAEVQQRALAWWRRGFEGRSSREDFRTLLDEMVGLGVLRQIGPDRYSLRSSNIAHLFGTSGDVLDDLQKAIEAEPAPEYDAARFRRPDTNRSFLRSPFTARQEAILLADRTGVQVALGHGLSGMEGASKWLELALGSNGALVRAAPVHMSKTEFERWLADQLERRREALTVLLVGEDIDWTSGWIAAAVAATARKTSQRSWWRVVFLGTPRQAWTLAANDERLEVRGEPVHVTTLGPWTATEIQSWLGDHLTGPNEPDFRDAILRATGGWGGLIHRLHDPVNATPPAWQARLERHAAEVLTDREIPARLGIRPEMWEVFEVLAAYQDPGGERLTLEDLVVLVDGYDARLTERVIRYAESLGLIQTSGTGWDLNPLVTRLLKVHTKTSGRP
jgi:hypothetical protein